MELRAVKHAKELVQMIEMAKNNGLKRLKVGSLEIELSDIELATQLASKLDVASNITNDNNATNTPTPNADASPALTEDDDESLLFHSSI